MKNPLNTPYCEKNHRGLKFICQDLLHPNRNYGGKLFSPMFVAARMNFAPTHWYYPVIQPGLPGLLICAAGRQAFACLRPQVSPDRDGQGSVVAV